MPRRQTSLSDNGFEKFRKQTRKERFLAGMDAIHPMAGIDLGREPAPDETAICKFRHLMERHCLGDELFHLVNGHLAANGLKVNRGTIVDATIIGAPCSAKNKAKARGSRDSSDPQGRPMALWHEGASKGLQRRMKAAQSQQRSNKSALRSMGK